MADTQQKKTIVVTRFDPDRDEAPRQQRYEIPVEPDWKVLDALVVHRVGTLKPTDQIVLVIVTSGHRRDAFAACEFIMDYLKTQAPFWKKEQSGAGPRWVEARESDDVAAERWRLKSR